MPRYDSLRITLQHFSTHCNTLPQIAIHCNTLTNIATNCIPLQHTTTYCDTLRHTATHCDTLQHTLKHCETLKHTATHCNTLQHTASHCNTPRPSARLDTSYTCFCSAHRIAVCSLSTNEPYKMRIFPQKSLHTKVNLLLNLLVKIRYITRCVVGDMLGATRREGLNAAPANRTDARIACTAHPLTLQGAPCRASHMHQHPNKLATALASASASSTLAHAASSALSTLPVTPQMHARTTNTAECRVKNMNNNACWKGSQERSKWRRSKETRYFWEPTYSCHPILQWLMADIYIRPTLFRHAYTGLFLPHRSRERLSFLLAFICNSTHLYVTCLIHIRDMTHHRLHGSCLFLSS